MDIKPSAQQQTTKTIKFTKMAGWGRLLLLLFTIPWLVRRAGAEPVQYCRFGDPERPNQDVDFCVGLTVHQNATTNAHNVYLTMTHTRRHLSRTGWTAVGVGDSMEGSLMFIIYGDPSSGEKPIVSIRSATGHVQPALLTREMLGGGDLHVLRSDWLFDSSPFFPLSKPEPDAAVAIVSLVCYSCTRWPLAPLSATTSSQPWTWAWNQDQEFDVYSYDAHLKMHKHHAGNGGWGLFYVDMARAVSSATPKQLPSVPVIRPGVAALGASDSPNVFGAGGGGLVGLLLTSWAGSPVLRLHGALMAMAFLVLFPAGVVAMRCGSLSSFKYHWIIQALASVFVAVGAAAGLMLQKRVDTAHQVLGLSLAVLLGVQAYLGWKHHVDFIRIRRRTWISHAHIWTGRAVLAGGGVNLVLGLVLRGYSQLSITLACLFVLVELLALVFWVLWRKSRNASQGRVLRAYGGQANGEQAWSSSFSQNQQYFTVGSEGDDEEGVEEEGEVQNNGDSLDLHKEQEAEEKQPLV